MFTCTIKWFNSAAQRVENKVFNGKKAMENAAKWGKATLENFHSDLIQTTYHEDEMKPVVSKGFSFTHEGIAFKVVTKRADQNDNGHSRIAHIYKNGENMPYLGFIIYPYTTKRDIMDKAVNSIKKCTEALN